MSTGKMMCNFHRYRYISTNAKNLSKIDTLMLLSYTPAPRKNLDPSETLTRAVGIRHPFRYQYSREGRPRNIGSNLNVRSLVVDQDLACFKFVNKFPFWFW